MTTTTAPFLPLLYDSFEHRDVGSGGCDTNYSQERTYDVTSMNVCANYSIFLKKWAYPGLFFVYFQSFSNKHYKFLQQIYVKKMSIQYKVPDSNPQPLERESPPITTRPGLLPKLFDIYRILIITWTRTRPLTTAKI